MARIQSKISVVLLTAGCDERRDIPILEFIDNFKLHSVSCDHFLLHEIE